MLARKGLFLSRRDSCERELSVSQNVKINFYSKIFSKSQNYAPTRSTFAIQSLTAVYQKKLFLYNVLRLPEITAWKCLLRKYLNLLTKRFLNTKTYIIPEYLYTELQNSSRGTPLSLPETSWSKMECDDNLTVLGNYIYTSSETCHLKKQIKFWNRMTFQNRFLVFLGNLKEPFGRNPTKISDCEGLSHT